MLGTPLLICSIEKERRVREREREEETGIIECSKDGERER